MKRLFFYIFLLFSLTGCQVKNVHPLAEDFRRLEETLGSIDEYVLAKEGRISAIEETLRDKDLTLQQKYGIYGRLYEEYAPYQFDKARDMLLMQESIADSLSSLSLRTTASLNKAFLYTTAGMFLEASKVFETLDTLSFDYQQTIIWYNARHRFLADYQEYMHSAGVSVPGAEKIQSYRNLIIENTPEDSYLHRHMAIMHLISDSRWDEAYRDNALLIESLNRKSRDYAVQTYWQGFICQNMDREEETLKWWIESAICDLQGAIKDNASLCSIAVNLNLPEETERAFRYIRMSLDDAVFYNAKLRKVQIASTMPLIEKAYIDAKEQQARDRSRYLLITMVIAFFLLLVAMVALNLHYSGRNKARTIETKNAQLAESNASIAEAEEILRKTNLELVEANAAKEEYLGLYLSMCSGYLDKLKKTLPRDQYEAELKNFYKTFDTSFLQLYPSFVEDFNALLQEDCRVALKEGELLNTELRIFALIKLGITQSSHIASLLRYSVNTIYNYRAQVKNSALSDRENFEETVKKIGSKC